MKKKLKKLKKLPGVTLLELVIVMAIFSGISVGALAMVRPALQLHYKTAAQERAVAAVDTMARFIQDNLRYADKMFVFKGHGIKDGVVSGQTAIETIESYPFGYENFKSKIEFIHQGPGRGDHPRGDITGTVSADGNTIDVPGFGTYALEGGQIVVTTGDQDVFHYANPVSAFAQYYLEESMHDRSGTYKTLDECDEYYKNKVIYVMEIKNTGEINVYSYPLAGDGVYYPTVNSGCTYNGTRGLSSVSDVFSGGKENINISKIEIGDDLSKGLNIKLSIEYKGAIIDKLTLNYNIAVNFMNLTSCGDTIHINDRCDYDAKRYIVFDWKDVDRMASLRVNRSSYYDPSKAQRAADPGYTYIVYSLPEIIP